MTSPIVSVVIPNHNGKQFLGQAIDSCLKGQDVDLEVIVVDDHSSDGSFKCLQERAKKSPTTLSVYRTEKGQQGACHARNLGLSKATGKYVKFLDSDDYLLPGVLGTQLEQQEIQSGSFSVYGDVRWVEEDGTACETQFKPDAGKTEVEQMVLGAPLTSAPLHRTEDVLSVTGFDTRVPRGQEYDLHIRMWLSGVQFVYQPLEVYCYRQHGGVRISSADGQDAVARGRLESLLRHVELARDKFGTPLSDEMAVAFANNLWRNGRRALQTGAKGVAREYFAAAKQIAGRRAVFGSLSYRLLTGLLGPRCAETLGAIGKS